MTHPNKRIAIQGGVASFHHQALLQYFKNEPEIIECKSFQELIKKAQDQTIADGGLMAIENSIAGSILPNYGLLQKSNLHITGEVYLSVQHDLMVIPGTTIDSVTEVHSHPMALLQCQDFLEKFNWEIIEKADTATSARELSQSGNKMAAVIASKMAAEYFNLEILRKSIQTDQENATRFLVLENEKNPNVSNANKASVFFIAPNASGSLARILNLIADEKINLSKLQSHPVPKMIWKYGFHADLEFDDVSQFHRAMQHIKPVTETIRVFGIYRNGKKS